MYQHIFTAIVVQFLVKKKIGSLQYSEYTRWGKSVGTLKSRNVCITDKNVLYNSYRLLSDVLCIKWTYKFDLSWTHQGHLNFFK